MNLGARNFMRGALTSERALSLACVLIGLVLVVWTYADFRDANYEDAWWLVAWLADLQLSDELLTTRTEAFYGLTCALVLVAWGLFSLMDRRTPLRFEVALLAGLVWISSPWNVVALQQSGPWISYAWLPAPVLITYLVSSQRARPWLPWCFCVTLLAVLLASIWLHSGRVADLLDPLIPKFRYLLPLSTHRAPAAGLHLLALWALLTLLVLAWNALAGSLPRSRLPMLIVLTLVIILGLPSLSQLVQLRGDPRLSILYSKAWGNDSDELNFALSEHFEMIGGPVEAEKYRQRLGVSDPMRMPRSYARAVECLALSRGRLPQGLSEPASPSERLVVEYLRRRGRCGS